MAAEEEPGEGGGNPDPGGEAGGAVRAKGEAREGTPPVEAAAERERTGMALLEEGRSAEAAATFSALMLDELGHEDPDREALARWSEAVDRAQERHRWSPKGRWSSIEVEVQPGDSLTAIRKRVLAEHPDLLISTGLVVRANQLPGELAIRPGDVLRIPTERASMLVDLDARWAVYLLGGEVADAWEIGIGREGSETPTGTFQIGLKHKEPMWFPPGRDPVPFGDPENPLGTRWLAWYRDGQGTSVGFHGTTGGEGIGEDVSQGCVRLRNAEVELLYEILPLGADVVVQP